MLEEIIAGGENGCVLKDAKVKLEVGGKNIEMVPFVQNILKNAVMGVVSELDGTSGNKDIVIKISK